MSLRQPIPIGQSAPVDRPIRHGATIQRRAPAGICLVEPAGRLQFDYPGAISSTLYSCNDRIWLVTAQEKPIGFATALELRTNFALESSNAKTGSRHFLEAARRAKSVSLPEIARRQVEPARFMAENSNMPLMRQVSRLRPTLGPVQGSTSTQSQERNDF